jgi:hypothetical protein
VDYLAFYLLWDDHFSVQIVRKKDCVLVLEIERERKSIGEGKIIDLGKL